MMFIAKLFDYGSSGYYLSAGDWKLIAPYVLDLQDIAAENLELTRQNKILREAINKMAGYIDEYWAFMANDSTVRDINEAMKKMALKPCGGGLK
jgi:hypothetical protein